jgi:multidrug efflux pump
MSPSDIFIKRPVLSTVLGFLILLLGLQGFFNLQVREYPEVEETVITVTTIYPGASGPRPDPGLHHRPHRRRRGDDRERRLRHLHLLALRLHRHGQHAARRQSRRALTEVMSKVQQVRSRLPSEAEDPTIVKGTGMTFATMYLAMQNPNMTSEQVTEYIERVIRPRMSTIEGVAEDSGAGRPDLRDAGLDRPGPPAGRGLTAAEVLGAINASNFLVRAGQDQGRPHVAYSITMETTLQTPEAFGALPIKGDGDEVVRLRDVARVELAAESTDTIVTFNGEPGTFIGVFPTPGANPLDMSAAVLAELPAIQASLPRA